MTDKQQKSEQTEPEIEKSVETVETAEAESEGTPALKKRKTHRGGFALPVVLVAVGVILLLNNFNVLDISLMRLLRFWPVLLILIGLDILIGRRSAIGSLLVALLAVVAVVTLSSVGTFSTFANGMNFNFDTGGGAQMHKSESLAEVQEIRASIDFAVGELMISSLPASSSDGLSVDLDSNFGGALDYTYSVQDNRATLTLQEEDETLSLLPDFDGTANRELTVNLSPDVPINLDVNTGAGEIVLDLEGLQIEDLDADFGVGDVTLILPDAGRFEVNLSMGIGNLTLIIPEGLEVSITRDLGIGDFDINHNRFAERSGDRFYTSGYDSAEHRVDINIDMGIGSVQIVG